MIDGEVRGVLYTSIEIQNLYVGSVCHGSLGLSSGGYE